MPRYPECGHEWSARTADDTATQMRDSVGNLLSDGDTVTVIKDLKLKGTSSVFKVGTRVRGIRLVFGDHDMDCKVPGDGPIGLKSRFVKKVADQGMMRLAGTGGLAWCGYSGI